MLWHDLIFVVFVLVVHHDVFLIYLKQPVFIFHFIKEVFQEKISFMGTAIKFISEFTFLFISTMNNDGTYHNISKTA